MSNVTETTAVLKDKVEDLIDLILENEDDFDDRPIHTGVVFLHEGRVWFEIGGPTYCNSFIAETSSESSNIYPYDTALDIEDIRSR